MEAINFEDPNLLSEKVFFDDLTPLHPDKRVVLEVNPERNQHARGGPDRADRLRAASGMIVSPPRAGKTILLQKNGTQRADQSSGRVRDLLLIDERPEEVTDMERQVKGPNCEDNQFPV